jgi:SAM-dependent methyltransferase
MADREHHDAAPAPIRTDLPDDVLRPQRPHDDLPFEELARRYNFRLTSDRRRVFTRLILKECQNRPSPVRVLDVGCGRGIGRYGEYLPAIRASADEFWGVEPDETVRPPEAMFDNHQHAVIEEAQLPSGHFDVAYSYMVMEHVVRPDEFMATVFACLKPGGVYLMATPNKRHYFTRTASILHALRLDEAVIHWIRKGGAVAYHYPVAYRFNDQRSIRRCADRIGFSPPQFAYLESEGPLGYFPAALRPVFHLLAAKRRLIQVRESLLTLLCRMTKPAVP